MIVLQHDASNQTLNAQHIFLGNGFLLSESEDGLPMLEVVPTTGGASGGVAGAGSGGKLAKWADSGTLTDSLISENAGTIVLGGATVVSGALQATQFIGDGSQLTNLPAPAGVLTKAQGDSYYAAQGHDHDTIYLKLAGGTVTGTIAAGAFVGDGSGLTNLPTGLTQADADVRYALIHAHPYLPLTGGIVTGTISATKFIGDGSGLTNLPVLTAQEADQRYAGLGHTHPYLPLGGGTVTGNVNLAGVFNVTEGAVNVAGVVTATKFVGDGSGLTNLPALLTKAQADTYYSDINHHHDARYLSLTGGQVTGLLKVIGTVNASMFVGDGSRLYNVRCSNHTGGGGGTGDPGTIDLAYLDQYYAPLLHVHDDRYLQLTGGVVNGDLTATRFIGDGSGLTNLPFYTQAQADARYALQSHNHDSSYLRLTGGTVSGNTSFYRPTDASIGVTFGTNGVANRWSWIAEASAGGYNFVLTRGNGATDRVMEFSWLDGTVTFAHNIKVGSAQLSTVGHRHAWTEIDGKPTSVAGYGITDAVTLSSGFTQGQIIFGQSNGTAARRVLVAGDGLAFTENATTGTLRIDVIGGGGGGGSAPLSSPTLSGTVKTDRVESDPTVYSRFTVNNLLDLKANAVHNHAWSQITSGKPTTLDGYGITDAIQNFGFTALDVLVGQSSGNATRRKLTAGTNITIQEDASLGTLTISAGGGGSSSLPATSATSGTVKVETDAPNGDPIVYRKATIDTLLGGKSDTSHTHSFASLTSRPSTLGGFGILDAYTKSEINGFAFLSQSTADSRYLQLTGGTVDHLDVSNGANVTGLFALNGSFSLPGLAVGSMLYGKNDGTFEMRTLQAGTNLTLDTATAGVLKLHGPSPVVPVQPAQLTLIPATGSDLVLNLAPAGVTEYDSNARVRHDLSNFTHARLVARVVDAGTAGCTLALQYSLDEVTWNYLDGISGPAVAVSAAGTIAGAYVLLDTPARADVVLRWVLVNGDGVASPAIGSAHVQFKGESGIGLAGGGNWVAKYVTATKDLSLANSITIPGLAGHPDQLPPTVTAADDEFDAALLDPKWTWNNQTGGSIGAVAIQNSHLQLTTPAHTGEQIKGIYQLLPASGNWKYRAKLALAPSKIQNGTACGVVLTDGTKQETFGFFYNNAYNIGVNRYTTVTTLSTTPTSVSLGGLDGFDGYLEVERSGTTITYRVSYNGIVFTDIRSHTMTEFLATAPTKIGLYVNAATGGGGAASTLVSDWFRRIA